VSSFWIGFERERSKQPSGTAFTSHLSAKRTDGIANSIRTILHELRFQGVSLFGIRERSRKLLGAVMGLYMLNQTKRWIRQSRLVAVEFG
jgi:hypothetical protein